MRLPWKWLSVRLSFASKLGDLACLLLRDSSSCLESATQRLDGAGATQDSCPGSSPHWIIGEARENVTTEDLDDEEALEDVREKDDPLEGVRRIDAVEALEDAREMHDLLKRNAWSWADSQVWPEFFNTTFDCRGVPYIVLVSVYDFDRAPKSLSIRLELRPQTFLSRREIEKFIINDSENSRTFLSRTYDSFFVSSQKNRASNEVP